MDDRKLPEPWLRGTLTNVPPVQRAVLHALELAKEDLERWCWDLSQEELNTSPKHLASVAFHLRHLARSMDRLLTYAEGKALSGEQISLMKAELGPVSSREAVLAELERAFDVSASRIRAFSTDSLSQARAVGRQQMPTTVAGLLVHVADHTQRHVGQAITTAKLVKSSRP
jgi:uncharacterized damage-inducible protein DinB